MPIICPLQLRVVAEEEFRALDYAVMGSAFSCQGELGRLCDEKIYQNDMAARLREAGISVLAKPPITVTHLDFCKAFFPDLVVELAAIYELKTVTMLTSDHERQILTYLLLLGGRYGKLVNFRSPLVEYHTVNAVPTPEEQRRFTLVLGRFVASTDRERHLVDILDALLKDWGAFLDSALYTEALIHFLGGASRVCRNFPLKRGEISLGMQAFTVLDNKSAFRLTTMPAEIENLEPHLRSLLDMSPLHRLHWINLKRHQIELITLEK
jgi:GxxExxY protein